MRLLLLSILATSPRFDAIRAKVGKTDAEPTPEEIASMIAEANAVTASMTQESAAGAAALKAQQEKIAATEGLSAKIAALEAAMAGADQQRAAMEQELVELRSQLQSGQEELQKFTSAPSLAEMIAAMAEVSPIGEEAATVLPEATMIAPVGVDGMKEAMDTLSRADADRAWLRGKISALGITLAPGATVREGRDAVLIKLGVRTDGVSKQALIAAMRSIPAFNQPGGQFSQEMARNLRGDSAAVSAVVPDFTPSPARTAGRR